MSPPALRRRWARAGNVLLVVLVTALQLAGLRSGSPARTAEVLAGVAGETMGVAAALIGGVALWWRRSRPVSVLAVCVAAYAVNAVAVPGVPPYGGGWRCIPRAPMAVRRPGRGMRRWPAEPRWAPCSRRAPCCIRRRPASCRC